MVEQEIELQTDDGAMPTHIFHPDGKGPFPLVLYIMDGPGVRPVLLDMARRLAGEGYYVMLPNLFYRGGLPVPRIEFGDEESRKRMYELMQAVTPASIVGDGRALLAHADADPAAATQKVGAVGFCMGGKLVLALCNAYPERLAAGASIHGGRLVTEEADSPHANVAGIKAELYFAWVDEDQTAPREHLEIMDKALRDAGVRYTIEFYDGIRHGFSMSDLPAYDEAGNERHWVALLDLFKRNLS